MMGRRFGEGLSFTAFAVGSIVLLGSVNWLAARHYRRFDWTLSRLYSISERTRQVLGSLERPLRIVVFLHSEGKLRSPVFDEVKELVERLDAASERVRAELIDPFKNRALAEELLRTQGIERAATIILEYGEGDDIRRLYVSERRLGEWDYSGLAFGDRPKLVAFRGEEVVAAAIEGLVSGRKLRVVFTAGHGEPSFKGERPNELGRVAEALRRENYVVEEWTGLAAREVPAETDVLIMAGPKTPLLPNEIAALEAYLASGGRLLALADPVFDPTRKELVETGVEGVLEKWGIRLGRDVVVDPVGHLPFFEADTLFTNRMRPHPITRGLEAFPIILPLARSVAITRAAADHEIKILIETSHQAWAETNLAGLPSAERDPDDPPGPVPLAVALGSLGTPLEEALEDTVPGAPRRDPPSNPAGECTRIVVFGDSELVSNELFDRNAPHILAAVNWLAERESLLGILPKKIGRVALRLTQDQIFDLQLVIFLILPGLVAAAGFVVWWRRRN